MSTSVFIARLLGPMFVLVGIALPLKTKMFQAILREFIGSPTLLYLAGFFGLLGGIALVLVHNVWVLDWRILITLLGWVTLVRAVVTIFRPDLIAAAGSKILTSRSIFMAAAAINLLIGLILSYFGYFSA